MRTTGICILGAIASAIVGTQRVTAQVVIPYTVASNLTVKVEGRVVGQMGPHVDLNYKVSVLPGSQQSGGEVLIRAFLPLTAYTVHGPSHWWGRSAVVQDTSVLEWSNYEGVDLVTPGTARVNFTVSANGLLDVVQAWVQADYEDPVVDADHELEPSPSWFVNSASTMTIGLVPVPSGSTVFSLVWRLKALVDGSCGSLAWITSPGLCNTLVSQLTGSSLRLGAFRDTLAANRTAGALVPDNPYYLLLANRDYIRSRITSSSLTLRYVCGKRFAVRNTVDMALPVSYTVNNTLEAGSLVLAPRPAGQPWSETQFTIINQGTVRVYYEGQLYGPLTPTVTSCP